MRVKLNWAAAAAIMVAALLAVAGCGSDDDGGGTSTGADAQTFTPRPTSGIKGALPPAERTLWTYDTDSGQVRRGRGRRHAALQARTCARRPSRSRSPTTTASAASRSRSPSSRTSSGSPRSSATSRSSTATRSSSPRRPSPARSSSRAKSPAFAIESNFQSGAAESRHAHLGRGQGPVRRRSTCGTRTASSSAPTTTSRASSAGGRRASSRKAAVGLRGRLGSCTARTPARARSANLRGTGFIDGVREVCGDLPDDQVDTDPARRRHRRPGDHAHHGLADGEPAGRARPGDVDRRRPRHGPGKAFAQAGRDGYAVGPGCDDIGIAALKDGAGGRDPLPRLRRLHAREVPRVPRLDRARRARGQAGAAGGARRAPVPRPRHHRRGLPVAWRCSGAGGRRPSASGPSRRWPRLVHARRVARPSA